METSLKLAVETMTEQEIFDTISVRLLAQGRSSMHAKTDSCAYSGDDGLHCAVGLVMSEEELAKIHNSTNTILNSTNFVVNIAGVFTVFSFLYCDDEPVDIKYNSRLSFLSKFQQVHDAVNVRELTDVVKWRALVTDGLGLIALRNGLDDSVLAA